MGVLDDPEQVPAIIAVTGIGKIAEQLFIVHPFDAVCEHLGFRESLCDQLLPVFFRSKVGKIEAEPVAGRQGPAVQHFENGADVIIDMEHEHGNGVQVLHFCDSLLPADARQGVFQVDGGPVTAEMNVAEMFCDLLSEGHTSGF